MTPFWAVVKRELWTVMRDRTISIAVLIQFFIASFSSGLFLGMLQLYDVDTILRYSGGAIRIGLVNATDNQLANFVKKHGITVVPFETLEEAETGFHSGEVVAIIDVPREADSITEIRIYMPESNTISSIVRMVIQEPLKEYENFLRIQKGVDIRYTDLQGEPSISFEFVYSVLLPLLMFFPAFVAGSLAIDALTEEFEKNTMETLLSAPLTVTGMIDAKVSSVVILAVAQCGIWLGLLKLNGIVIQNAIWVFLLALIISGITSISAALGAVLLQDRERSQFIYALMLLTAIAVSTLLNASPITTLSRLAIGDYYTNGWSVAAFAVFLAGLYLLLRKISRRLSA
ncbi:MAG TPA: ABC transporter permease [Anaerolineales bacterium]|nr:ABC transporter permease [Anaerolineales bacterium]